MRQGLLRDALTRLGEKWTPGLIYELAAGPRRYGELRRELGIAPKVLTSTLRNLERDGFVSRLRSPSIPLQVSYELTRLGCSFHELLLDIEGWAARNETVAEGARPARDTDRVSTRPVAHRDDHDGNGGGDSLHAWPTHLCIAVRDLEQAAADFSFLFGVAGLPSAFGTVVGPGDSRGEIKQCAFPMSNFCIELIQPVNGSTPFRDFLQRFGQGFHHIGMRVRGSLEQEMRLLTRKGGREAVRHPRAAPDLDARRRDHHAGHRSAFHAPAAVPQHRRARAQFAQSHRHPCSRHPGRVRGIRPGARRERVGGSHGDAGVSAERRGRLEGKRALRDYPVRRNRHHADRAGRLEPLAGVCRAAGQRHSTRLIPRP